MARQCKSDGGTDAGSHYEINVGEGLVTLLGTDSAELSGGMRASGGATCPGCESQDFYGGCSCPANMELIMCRGPYSGNIYQGTCCPY
jgi:hypothetical protein